MALWEKASWYDSKKRKEQLDLHVNTTGAASFGLKKYNADEKVDAVITHFNRVARKYDFMNSLLSFGIQHLWKRTAVRLLKIKKGESVIDVCGGTGDLAILAAKKIKETGHVTIYDINRAMMLAGRNKFSNNGMGSNISLVQGDAESISFPDNHFNVAMVGFGIRNLTHLQAGFNEMYRVLKPGGRLLCLEFSKPLNSVFRWLYDFYSFNIMPLLGQLLVGSAESYACLSETIRMFPLPDELCNILTATGFNRVCYHSMTNGIAVAHMAYKRGEEV
jgi:demethylmenaquinone methyltransferase/2-methoxy-6-polyprenyl-1,4-benzoquinol methylase